MKVRDLAAKIGASVVAGDDIDVSSISSLESAAAGSVVFVDNPKFLENALTSPAAAVIATEFPRSVSSKGLVLAREPKLAFARAARVLHPPRVLVAGVHETAIIAESATVAGTSSIGAHTCIDENTKIGSHCQIGRNCSIGENVQIGEGCIIKDNVTIYPNSRFGDRVVIHSGVVLGCDGFGYVRRNDTGQYEQFPQIGSLEVGNDVEIGANTTIDRGALGATIISDGVKIDNLVHIGHNVKVGRNVVIAAQVGISGSVTIEDNVVFAGQVGIGDHAHIGEGVILGGQGGVLPHKVIRGKGILFWGTPVKPVREYLKELAFVSRLAKKSEKKEK